MSYSAKLGDQPKRLRGLYLWLRGFFLMNAVGTALVGVGSVYFLIFGIDSFYGAIEFTIGDGLMALGGLLVLIALFPGMILFCILSYRATRNIHIRQPNSIDTTPAASIYWYFVPVMNLFKPLGAMYEIWYGSQPSKKAEFDTPKIMMLWWAG